MAPQGGDGSGEEEEREQTARGDSAGRSTLPVPMHGGGDYLGR